MTKKQFAKIERFMPIARKKPNISNYQFMCALLYIIENGCKWRALPKKYGNWHTIYMRFSRWSQNGTIQKIFEELQEMNIIDNRTDILCLDSTSIKVHLMQQERENRAANRVSDVQKGADNEDTSLLCF